MRYCCVPSCTSSERNKGPGVTFYELPYDNATRARWITAIAREDSAPKTTSYYTVVCSLHFKTSDFRDGCKRRLLKRGAIPSVFGSRVPRTEKCGTLAKPENRGTKKRKREPSPSVPCVPVCGDVQDDELVAESTAAPSTEQTTELQISPSAAGQTSKKLPRSRSSALAFEHGAIAPIGTSHEPAKNAEKSTNVATALENEEPKRKARAKRSLHTQTVPAPSASTFFVQRKWWRQKERVMRAKIERLSRTVDAYKQELQKLKESCYVSAFLEVVADAEDGIAKAVLLRDQVKNYTKKKPQWSEVTIRHCIVIQHLSTKCTVWW